MASAQYELTEGSLLNIMKGAKIEDPLMQVLGSKKIAGGNSDKERFRILLSDGKYLISFAMLTPNVTESVNCQDVPKFSIIKLKRYITSVINSQSADKRVLVILDMEVMQAGESVGDRIGTPQQLTDGDMDIGTDKSSSNNKTASTETDERPAKRPATVSAMQATKSVSSSNDLDVSMKNKLTFPISSLSPYQNQWVIKAMVTNKSPLKQWSNSRGSGCLFSMDFLDSSGEIRATAFREMAEKYFDFVQVDKTYYVSKCQIKMANKQFNNIKNDHELTFTNETVLQECHDADSDIKVSDMYNFIEIGKISDMEVGSLVDIIAVCKECSEVQAFKAKASGRDMKKRELNLVDRSNCEISLAIWGKEAEDFNGGNNPVVVMRGAKITEFLGGKNLSTGGGQIKIDPDMPEAHKLKGWFDGVGKTATLTNLSTRTGGGGSGGSSQWLTFLDIEEDPNFGNSEKGAYYQAYGVITLINSERIGYKACPKEGCNKKVIDQENGQFRCEKCDENFTDYKYRLLGSIHIGDFGSSQWGNMFNDEVEKVLGCKSQEVGEAVDAKDGKLAEIVSNATFTEGIFKMRAKMNVFNDESRLKHVVTNFEKVNDEYRDYAVTKIEEYTGLKFN